MYALYTQIYTGRWVDYVKDDIAKKGVSMIVTADMVKWKQNSVDV